jgi:hypothetical protein
VRRSQDNSGPNVEGQCLKNTFCARFVIADAIYSHWSRQSKRGASLRPVIQTIYA